MKILFEHADYFRYTQDKKLNSKIGNCLVIRLCFERKDAEKIEIVVNELKKIHEILGTSSMILFPFSHLSNNLLDAKEAERLLYLIEQELKDLKIIVKTPPFGVNKGYELFVKEHGLNNIYRQF